MYMLRNRALASLLLIVVGHAASAQTPDAQCETLLAQQDIRLEDALAADCQLSPEQISALIDNPVGEVVSVPLQFDRLSLTEPFTGRDLTVETTKLIPTFPVRIGNDWSLVNRVVIPKIKVPIDSSALAMLGTRSDVGLIAGDPTTDIFSGSTDGVGDLAYVGLFTPRDTKQTPNGKIIWAVGPTAVLPTADEDILGQGQYQLGPAVAYGFLGNRWTVGALAQHWWSVGGDGDRSSVNQTNVQYFYYYKLGNQWSIGASPNASMDWTGSGSPTINLPIGIGINKTLFIGRLPVRVGLEASRYVKHESALKPEWGVRLSITPAIPSALLSALGGR